MLLTAPTVNGQKSIAAISVAIQLGAEEPGGLAEQLSSSTLRSVGDAKRCHGLIRHVVVPDSDEYTGIRLRDDGFGAGQTATSADGDGISRRLDITADSQP
jgi:hypothetical protein